MVLVYLFIDLLIYFGREGVEMFWKGWSCIGIQNTGVKEIQLLCSFLPEI